MVRVKVEKKIVGCGIEKIIEGIILSRDSNGAGYNSDPLSSPNYKKGKI